MLRVRVRYEDTESRTELKKKGFRWNPQLKLWDGEDTPEHRELLDRLGLKPEGGSQAVATHSSDDIDRRDEEQMRRELMNEVMGEYIYDFVNKEGRRIVGVSWAGAKRLARTHLPGLDVELIRVDHAEDWIGVVVKVKTDKGSALGAAQMPAQNRFAYPIAVNKAQRNAIMNLLDEALIKKVIERQVNGQGQEAVLKLLETQVA